MSCPLSHPNLTQSICHPLYTIPKQKKGLPSPRHDCYTIRFAVVFGRITILLESPASVELTESFACPPLDNFGFDSLSQPPKLDALDAGRELSASDSDTHDSGGNLGVASGEINWAPKPNFPLLSQTPEEFQDDGLLVLAR
jgi:hypothetical protein